MRKFCACLFTVLVSTVVIIVSIPSQKLFRMLQRFMRARALREEGVEMHKMGNAE